MSSADVFGLGPRVTRVEERTADHETRLAVHGERLDNVEDSQSTYVAEVRSLRHAIILTALTVASSSVLFAFTIYIYLGRG